MVLPSSKIYKQISLLCQFAYIYQGAKISGGFVLYFVLHLYLLNTQLLSIALYLFKTI